MCGMVELGQDPGLGEVSLGVLGAGDPLGVGHLDRHRAVEVIVLGEVDAAEPALAEPPDHPVAADSPGEASPGRSRETRVHREGCRGSVWIWPCGPWLVNCRIQVLSLVHGCGDPR